MSSFTAEKKTYSQDHAHLSPFQNSYRFGNKLMPSNAQIGKQDGILPNSRSQQKSWLGVSDTHSGGELFLALPKQCPISNTCKPGFGSPDVAALLGISPPAHNKTSKNDMYGTASPKAPQNFEKRPIFDPSAAKAKHTDTDRQETNHEIVSGETDIDHSGSTSVPSVSSHHGENDAREINLAETAKIDLRFVGQKKASAQVRTHSALNDEDRLPSKSSLNINSPMPALDSAKRSTDAADVQFSEYRTNTHQISETDRAFGDDGIMQPQESFPASPIDQKTLTIRNDLIFTENPSVVSHSAISSEEKNTAASTPIRMTQEQTAAIKSNTQHSLIKQQHDIAPPSNGAIGHNIFSDTGNDEFAFRRLESSGIIAAVAAKERSTPRPQSEGFSGQLEPSQHLSGQANTKGGLQGVGPPVPNDLIAQTVQFANNQADHFRTGTDIEERLETSPSPNAALFAKVEAHQTSTMAASGIAGLQVAQNNVKSPNTLADAFFTRKENTEASMHAADTYRIGVTTEVMASDETYQATSGTQSNLPTKPTAFAMSDSHILQQSFTQDDAAGERVAPILDEMKSQTPNQAMLGAQTSAVARFTPTQALNQLGQLVVRGEDGVTEVKLNPEELGKIRFQISHGEHGLIVHISADRPDTMDLMRRHIEMLQQDLKDNGFVAAQFEFSSGNNSSDQTGDGQTDSSDTSSSAHDDSLAQDDIPTASLETNTMPSGGLDIRL